MIEFLKDWQAYRAGATVAAGVLGGGVVDALAKRGIVRAAGAPVAAAPVAAEAEASAPAAKPKKPARR